MRVCEASVKLGGTACTYFEALANADVTSKAGNVSFRCPQARDSIETGGRYVIYTGALVDGDATAAVSCK